MNTMISKLQKIWVSLKKKKKELDLDSLTVVKLLIANRWKSPSSSRNSYTEVIGFAFSFVFKVFSILFSIFFTKSKVTCELISSKLIKL